MKVEIYDRERDEIRAYQMDCSDADVNAFIWEEGNYACDCNRGLFFERARGGKEGDLDDHPCSIGEAMRYAVLSVKTDAGELIYFESDQGEAWLKPDEEWLAKHFK